MRYLKLANRRLISKSIHQSNKFLQLSVEDRYLYDELVLYADDDGFCSELTMINVLNHFTEKNYQELEKAGLIIVSDGVVIIVDWLNNQDLKNHTNTQQIELAKNTYIRTDWKYTTNLNDENVAMTLNDFLHKYNSKKTGIDLENLKETRNKLIKAESASNSPKPALVMEDKIGENRLKKAEKASPQNNDVQALERQGIDTHSNEAGGNRQEKPKTAFLSTKSAYNINKYNINKENINKEKESLPQKSSTVNQKEIEQLIKFINSKFKTTFSTNNDQLIYFLSNELKVSSIDEIKDTLTVIKEESSITPETDNLCLSYIKNEYPKSKEKNIDDELPF